MHCSAHEAINENRAGFLVNFIFDRIGIHRDFDDDVEIVWQIAPGRYLIQTHGVLSSIMKKFATTFATRNYNGSGPYRAMQHQLRCGHNHTVAMKRHEK